MYWFLLCSETQLKTTIIRKWNQCRAALGLSHCCQGQAERDWPYEGEGRSTLVLRTTVILQPFQEPSHSKVNRTSSGRGKLTGELNLVILLSCDGRLDRIISPDCQRLYKSRLSQRETIPQMATKGWGKPNSCLTLGKVTKGWRLLAGREKIPVIPTHEVKKYFSSLSAPQ